MINDMSKPFTLVLGIAVLLLTGLVFGKLSNLLRVPKVTGYLLGGLFVGPALLGLIFPNFGGIVGKDYVTALGIIANIELGFIAFSVGSEFKVSFLKKVGIMPVVVAFAESLAAVLFITGGMMLLGLIMGTPTMEMLPFALCMGAVGGATAPAATVMVINQYKAKGDLAKTTLSVVAVDDASALIFFGFAMAIVKSIVNPDAANIGMTIAMPFIEIFGSLLLGAVSGIIITFLARAFKSRGNRMVVVIMMVFANIGISLLLQEINFGTAENPVHMGLSSLMSCMAMGAIFTNVSPAAEEVMPLVDDLTPPFVILFFVLSGADLELKALANGVVWAVLGVYLVFRIAGKILGTMASAKACKAPPKIQKWLGWGLLPQGGIAIGLSIIVMNELGDNGGSIFNGQLVRIVVICAVFVSEIFGPMLLKHALIKSGEGVAPERKPRKGRHKAIAGGAPNVANYIDQTTPDSCTIADYDDCLTDGTCNISNDNNSSGAPPDQGSPPDA